MLKLILCLSLLGFLFPSNPCSESETAKANTSNALPTAGPVPHPTSTRFLAYEELKEATNNFESSSILGEGGFGKVFKGTLSDGTQVAIKRLTNGGQQGGKEFLVEVEMLSRLHHRNLVKLVGYYSNRDSSQNLLCYELVPNGSLEQWLHGNYWSSILCGILYLFGFVKLNYSVILMFATDSPDRKSDQEELQHRK